MTAETTDTRTIGKRVSRVEDPSLVRGKARFVDDIHIDGMLHAVFVRSQYAHARIRSIAKSAALEMPGIRAVLTAADIGPYLTADRLKVALPDRSYKQQRDRPILAVSEVAYVGEPFAVVIADDPYLAEDAAMQVGVEYEPLPAATECRAALLPGANLVHADATTNLLAEFTSGYGDADDDCRKSGGDCAG